MDLKLQIMFQQATHEFQRNNLERAESILLKLLKLEKKFVPALSMLAIIKAMNFSHQEAIELFQRAIKITPKDPSLYYNLAKVLQDSGADYDSLQYHKKAVSLAPNNIGGLVNYGMSLSRIGLNEESLDILTKAFSINPNFLEVVLNKSSVLKALKRYNEALQFADKALAINPNIAEAWNNRGAILNELNRFDEALLAYEKSLALNPSLFMIWYNKGLTLHELKRFDEAIAHYDQATSLNPEYIDAWSNKAISLHSLKRFEEALIAYEKSLALNPSVFMNWHNKGLTLIELKRFDEAIAHFEKALSLKPEIDWAYGDLLHLKMNIGSWSDLSESFGLISKKVMAKEKVVQPFVLLSLNDNAMLHKKSAEIFIHDKYPINQILGNIKKRKKQEKIRIAYFSADFKNHPLAFLTAELFEIHDKDRFEVFAFSLQIAPIGDEMTLRLRKSFNRFIDVENMLDQEIAQLARELEIDIAIDLSGHTHSSRPGIFSYRAAPIQVNWLGYAGTIGAEFIDYIIADKVLIPEIHQQFYTEKVVYLPDTYIVDDSRRIASSRMFTKEEFGLPVNAFIFCCFNNAFKFNPQVLDGWSKILLEVDRSILWITENNNHFKANMTAEFNKRGIDPSRIIFAQRMELMSDHLARCTLADIFLDTHPYNAHTTTMDFLKVGVPVLTLIGESFASRVAASLLNTIGLPELIANTQDEYVALAIELAKNPEKLSKIKQTLIESRLTTPLFDTPKFTRHIEIAYMKIMERFWDDLPPEHIYIESYP